MTLSNTQQLIDELMARFFSAFDNRHGARPQLDTLVDCFSEKAVIARVSDTGTDLMTVEKFAVPRINLLCHGDLIEFHEWEISATTEIHVGLATRTSRYGKAGVLNGMPYGGTGTKCFHIVNAGDDWRICALAWVDD